MDLHTQREQTIRHYIDAYNRFDIDGMLRDLHPDVVFANVSGGEVNMTLEGMDAFRRQAEEAVRIFSARQQDILNISFYDDTAEVTIHYKGVLATDLPRGLKKDDTIELNGRSLFEFRGAQIIRLTDIS